MKRIISGVLIITGTALAHARFVPGSPFTLRNPRDGIKEGQAPCGGNVAGERLVLKAGQTISINFNETIDHEAKYVIRFSRANDTFSTPLMDVDLINNDTIRPNMLTTRQDGQGAVNRNNTPRLYQVNLTMPHIVCDTCTIQLIQRMFDGATPTNYYSCADIQLTQDPAILMDQKAPSAPSKLQITRENL